MTALTVNMIRGGYAAADVIHGLSFDLAVGDAIGVIGRNGSGKTCLANLLIGTLRSRGGSIELDGRAITNMTVHQRIRAGISIVPEGRMVFPQLTVRENLTAAAYGAGLKVGNRELQELESRFEVLATKRHDRAGAMSGGEQQILAIARAMIQKPRVIILDEPSLGLAPVMVKAVSAALSEIRKDGPALILMEQNRSLVADLCSVVHVMSSGTIALTASPAELLDDAVGDLYLGA
ncbi:ABC transporter ATP-binding protein [Rhodococcus qingshengii]|uniref:ABC transporter ATP-binding protein n=1 Tax=Rhodococcus qingshengii TaxID=334542 RepID=UPI001A5AA470|nr:ATP-binding cassette domain-containing protein [Rhodococcus qingshengii]ULD45122.1 ATP-binding cassette domain-containing protein [Rhodococcus qingshengii]